MNRWCFVLGIKNKICKSVHSNICLAVTLPCKFRGIPTKYDL